MWILGYNTFVVVEDSDTSFTRKMRCHICNVDKLSKEFPRENITDTCDHPPIHCLRVITGTQFAMLDSWPITRGVVQTSHVGGTTLPSPHPAPSLPPFPFRPSFPFPFQRRRAIDAMEARVPPVSMATVFNSLQNRVNSITLWLWIALVFFSSLFHIFFHWCTKNVRKRRRSGFLQVSK